MPASVRDRDRQIGLGAPVLRSYERTTFERELTRVRATPRADLLAPGHPLLDSVVDLTVERYGSLLKQGAVLVDRTSTSEEPRLLVAVTQEITDGHQPARTVSKRFDFVQVRADGTAEVVGAAPYLDYEPPTGDELAVGAAVRRQPWLASGAERRARELEQRLDRRLAELDRDAELHAKPPLIAGAALVLPQGLLDRLTGVPATDVPAHAKDTAAVERRAVDAVLAAERRLGRTPEEMPHNKPGFDIRSRTLEGHWLLIEVKGRIEGATEFHLTRNEVLHGKNSATSYRLALVGVSQDGPAHDEVRYLTDPFTGFEFGDFAATGLRGDWNEMWNRGHAPR